MTTTPNRRRRLIAAAAFTAAALGMAACSSSSSPHQANANDKVTLSILTHLNPATQKAMDALDAAFHQKYPNITVQVQAVDTNQVESVRNTRMQAKNLDITEVFPFQGATHPDYVKGQQPNIWGQLIAANKFVDLSGQSFLKSWEQGALDAVGVVNGKTYAIPTGRDVVTGMYYNKDIFAKYNLSVPKTWSEFVAVCNTLKSHGVTPIIIGGKDGWTNGMPMLAIQQALYPTEASKWALDKALWTGTGKYTDAKNVDVLQKTKTIFSYTQPGFAGITNLSADSRFAAGQAAMFPQGSWEQPNLLQANPKLNDGYFPLPASDNAADNNQWGGKYEIAWSVLTSSPHRDAALKWMAFYSDPANYAKFIQTTGFIPAEPNIPSGAFNDSLNVTDKNFSLNFQNIQTLPANAAQQAGFDYTDIAPVGKYTDMNKLAQAEQAAWEKATK